MKILLLNGPNLNSLGKREPELYGKGTLADIEKKLRTLAAGNGSELECFQTNHEGSLIDKIQESTEFDGLIINPGGLTHTSVSLRDALAILTVPIVEVHISNIYAREEFRRHSMISDVCTSVISGLGSRGYEVALEFLLSLGSVSAGKKKKSSRAT